ncbi:MAG: peptide deformylase [Candidatus Moranbacteria bacterium CG_4_9_14_3_um_filter_40_7]|nr:MAG: peptide deformylase [Candidatus Moranbacteria bacterium CG23_combo_of_CG06-09_8_20_14_all_40_16]PIU80661.1 MAG: peptide deformylase [Candidatus Moranbacteria bacterium CG06_land_8_20_14_3_00_40_12]PJA88218.1 MAG: peptide deformylase [Candidatus Moranbacteria bacterium CG_4_9_14_3_um_filter_40_7]
MAQLKILIYPHPFLKKKTREVEDFQAPEIKRLVLDMLETMEKNNGLGLSANQVGRSERVCVIKLEGKTYILINPRLKSKSWSKTICEEGCLSFPGKFIPVKRSKKISLEAWDKNGRQFFLKAAGLLARAIQHEVDHLDGILFTEREARPKKK